MDTKKYITFFLSIILFLPQGVFAVSFPELPNGFDVDLQILTANLFDPIFNFIWPFFAAFAVIMLIRAAYFYIRAKVDEANKSLFWAMVGIAVGLMAFSIPFIIKSALNI